MSRGIEFFVSVIRNFIIEYQVPLCSNVNKKLFSKYSSLLYSDIQVLHYLQKVNFITSFGDQMSFDENGDALPIYDIMNWLQLPDGTIKLQNVGEVKRSAFKGEELIVDEDKIFWNLKSQKVAFSETS